MKKNSIVLFLIMLILAGCNNGTNYPSDNTYHFETDSQYSFYNQGAAGEVAQSPDGYYFALVIHGEHYMFFTDKNTMQAVPLCGRPNCLHYEETDADKKELCNARYTAAQYEGAVYYYKGKLYVPASNLNEYVLYEFSLDGASRKELWKIDAMIYGNNLVFHRGYMYVATSLYNENMQAQMRIQRYSLENPGRKPETLFEKTLDKDAKLGGMNHLQDLKAYGNHLYFTLTENSFPCFYTIDLTDGNYVCKEVLENVGEVTDTQYNLSISDGILIAGLNNQGEVSHLTGMDQLLNLPTTLYRMNLDGSSPREILKFSYGPFTSDNQYIYQWPYWALWRDGNIDEYYIRIYDREGSLLVEYDAAKDVSDFYMLYASQGDHVFLTVSNCNKVYYFSKSEIESGEIHPKLLIDCSQYQ